jgi:hypothetical protein
MGGVAQDLSAGKIMQIETPPRDKPHDKPGGERRGLLNT